MPKAFWIIGPSQNGSTRLFNCLILIIQQSGKTVDSCWWKSVTDLRPDVDYHIVKAHEVTESIRDLIQDSPCLLPFRDVRDAAISFIHRFEDPVKTSLDRYIEIMVDMVAVYRHSRPIASIILRYDHFGFRQILQLSEWLGVSLTSTQALKVISIVNGLFHHPELPSKDDHQSQFYQKHLLSRHHNTSGGRTNKFREIWTPEQNKKILQNRDIYNHLVDFGFETAK